MEPPHALRTFRRSFYECLHRRGDALFELADAILAADGAAPSPVHLSLQASHRRGWGSLYAALNRGRIDDEALMHLQSRLSARCYDGWYETTYLRASDLGRRARGFGGRLALARRFRPPPLSDPARQLPRRERLQDRPLVGLRLPDGAHRHKALQRGGPQRGSAPAPFSAQEDPCPLRRGAGRAVARDASSKPQGVR